MPFQERRFPPGWVPHDVKNLRDNYSGDNFEKLKKTLENLKIETKEIWGADKEPRELINLLHKARGLPYRDSRSSDLHDAINKSTYCNNSTAAKWAPFTLLRVRVARDAVKPECMTRLFHVEIVPQSKEGDVKTTWVRIGLKGCTCLCQYYEGERLLYCKHILYVLQDVLNCPNVLPVHDAFTQEEYDDVFAHSFPAQALKNAKCWAADWRKVLDRVPKGATDIVYDFKARPNERLICLRCFHPVQESVCCPCSGCGNLIHSGSCYSRKSMGIFSTTKVTLERYDRADRPRCSVCESRRLWEEWTKAPKRPLLRDSEPKQLDEVPLETKLKSVCYKIGNKIERFK